MLSAFKSAKMADTAIMTSEQYLYWRAKESRWRVHLVSRGHHFENHFSVNEYGSRQRRVNLLFAGGMSDTPLFPSQDQIKGTAKPLGHHWS